MNGKADGEGLWDSRATGVGQFPRDLRQRRHGAKCGNSVANSPAATGMMRLMKTNTSRIEPGPARAALQARLAEINEEIAHYPQPIARCDAQLGGLLEERLRLRALLEEQPPPER